MENFFQKEVLEIASDKRLVTGIICKGCSADDVVGYFRLNTELCLQSENDHCSMGYHRVSKELYTFMSSSLEKQRKKRIEESRSAEQEQEQEQEKEQEQGQEQEQEKEKE